MKTKCKIKGCDNDHYANGMCRMHDARVRRLGTPYLSKSKKVVKCSVDECRRIARVKDLCPFHYNRKVRGVDLNRPYGVKGELNHNWKNGVAEYPNHSELKRIRLTVLEEEKNICKYCGGPANEVHHIDGSKDNHQRGNLTACCHSCNLKQAGPKKTSKFIRKYGIPLRELSQKFNMSIHEILKTDKDGISIFDQTKELKHDILRDISKHAKLGLSQDLCILALMDIVRGLKTQEPY